MTSSSGTKRAQFSSCDACRRARVACNAARVPQRSGEAPCCSRCAARSQDCTFEWIDETKKRRSQTARHPVVTDASFVMWGQKKKKQQTTGPRSSDDSPSTSSTNPCKTEALIPKPEVLEQWTTHMFHSGIENICGRWIGQYGCPLVHNSKGDVLVTPLDLFSQLDLLMNQQLGHPEISGPGAQLESKIQGSLAAAVQAYASRWIPLLTGYEMMDRVREQWRNVRRDMLRVINRLSYRSVLTLYLFGQTPVPAGILEDEEKDGMTGTVCIQAALKQLQLLRGRLRTYQFDGSNSMEEASWADAEEQGPRSRPPPESFLELETRAYWTAVMWDTAGALTLNVRSSLVTGLKGGCSEPAWILTRSLLVDPSFRQQAESWTRATTLSDDLAQQMIAAVDTARLYVWRTSASLKEGLVEGEVEEAIVFAWSALQDALDLFRTTARPLLDRCEQSLASLGQANRFAWYQAALHYHLGILMVVDAVEVGRRDDLQGHLAAARTDSERQLVGVIEFGLDSPFELQGPPRSDGDAATTCLVAVDPFPHNVVACARLLARRAGRKNRRGDMQHDDYTALLSTLSRALARLPQSTKSVLLARGQLGDIMRATLVDDA